MLFLILFLVFVLVAVGCWFQGLWSCAINLVNLLLAALIATNFWEPLATYVEGFAKDQAYVLDAPILWALFVISYFILRMISQGLSDHNIFFIKPVEYAGRTILAIWCAWVFTCFTAFTMVTAPIGATPLGGWSNPNANSFLFLSPERQWMAFAQSRSMGALARNKFSSAPVHPQDAQSNVEAFDPLGEFTFKYYARRKAAE
jgi:hypothetical protein